MSGTEDQITCRRCRETISLESKNCPHCGTAIRDSIKPMGVVFLGVILVAASALNISDLLVFGLFGLALVGAGGWVLYDKRKRINEASEEAQAEFSIGSKVE